ncbi:hypothetical protein BH20ACT24_BH20ACT24_23010 [soil metagenome]
MASRQADFGTAGVANGFVAALRWPDGPECPSCAGKELGYIKTRQLWKCRNKDCRRQFSAKVGTIFEDSPIALGNWLASIWLIADASSLAASSGIPPLRRRRCKRRSSVCGEPPAATERTAALSGGG